MRYLFALLLVSALAVVFGLATDPPGCVPSKANDCGVMK